MDEDQIDYQNIQNVKNIAIDNYKYSSRRYDVVCLVFVGFGLYANYELYKSVNELNIGTGLLFASTLILLILAFVCLWVLNREMVFQETIIIASQSIEKEPETDRVKIVNEIDALDKRQHYKRGIIYVGLILCVVLTLVGFVVLSLG